MRDKGLDFRIHPPFSSGFPGVNWESKSFTEEKSPKTFLRTEEFPAVKCRRGLAVAEGRRADSAQPRGHQRSARDCVPHRPEVRLQGPTFQATGQVRAPRTGEGSGSMSGRAVRERPWLRREP